MSKVPIPDSVFLLTFSIFIAIFHAVLPLYPSAKKRSWILTALGSFTMSIGSTPFFWDYISSGGDVTKIGPTTVWADRLIRVFQGYLTADLLMGAIYYRSHVTLIMGWIHHAVYLLLVHYVVQWRWSHIFCLCAVMELPTFLLAAASLHPVLRSDLLFATTFFSTRILFHIVMFVSYVLPYGRNNAIGGSYAPPILLALAFPMHAIWFSGCVKGFIKRAKARKQLAETSASPSAKSSKSKLTTNGDALLSVSIDSSPNSTLKSRNNSTGAPRRPALRTLPIPNVPTVPQRAYSEEAIRKIKLALLAPHRREAVRRIRAELGAAVRRARGMGRGLIGRLGPEPEEVPPVQREVTVY